MASELREPGPEFHQSSRHGLEVTIEPKPTGVVLLMQGEVDMASVPALKTALDQVMADSFESVVVDLSGVTFMDSTGLAALVRAYQRLSEASRAFGVRNPLPAVERLFHITGLDGLLAGGRPT